MTERNNKICHPELGCSGDLNLTVVHTLNVGDLCSDLDKIGEAAPEVECRSRSGHSSQSGGKPHTRQRSAVSQQLPEEVGDIPRKQRELAQLNASGTDAEY